MPTPKIKHRFSEDVQKVSALLDLYTCHYCGGKVVYHSTSNHVYAGKDFGPVYSCETKRCNAYVGASKIDKTVPAGIVAKTELRELRKEVHAKIEELRAINENVPISGISSKVMTMQTIAQYYGCTERQFNYMRLMINDLSFVKDILDYILSSNPDAKFPKRL
jgi:hypothetical protein